MKSKFNLPALFLCSLPLLVALTLLAQPIWSPRPRPLAVFCGTGLLAADTFTNNGTSGKVGGLGSAIISTGAPLYNVPGGIGIAASYAQHSAAASNVFLEFSLSADGTNFGGALQLFSGVSAQYISGATNGLTIFSNFPAAVIANATHIRFDRLTNACAISNLTIAISQNY